MERTKQPIGKESRFLNENLIVTDKRAQQILMRGNPDALSLYHFLIMNGNRKQSEQIRANETYCVNGCHLGVIRFRKAKKVLVDMKLISISQKRISKISFGESYVHLLRCDYMEKPWSVGFDRSLINKAGKDDFLEKLKCSECGNPLFISGRLVPDRLVSTDKYIILKNNKRNQSKAELPPSKKEIVLKPIPKKYKCPNGYKFGIDTDKYDECEDCSTWGKCSDMKHYKNYPEQYLPKE